MRQWSAGPWGAWAAPSCACHHCHCHRRCLAPSSSGLPQPCPAACVERVQARRRQRSAGEGMGERRGANRLPRPPRPPRCAPRPRCPFGRRVLYRLLQLHRRRRRRRSPPHEHVGKGAHIEAVCWSCLLKRSAMACSSEVDDCTRWSSSACDASGSSSRSAAVSTAGLDMARQRDQMALVDARPEPSDAGGQGEVA